MKTGSSLLGIHAIHGIGTRQSGGSSEDFFGIVVDYIQSFKQQDFGTLADRIDTLKQEPVTILGLFLFLILAFTFRRHHQKKSVRFADDLPSRRSKSQVADRTSGRDRPAKMGSKSSGRKANAQHATKEQGDGCYLTYETDSGGRLMICYQKGGSKPKNAVGFWAAGKKRSIQDFKFKQNGGRSEIIRGIAGGDANRRKYFEGWCQYLKLAKAKHGIVQKFPGCGVEVDIYGFDGWESKSYFLSLESKLLDISKFDAVAVIPKHKDFLQGVTTLNMSTFLQMGATAGASTFIK